MLSRWGELVSNINAGDRLFFLRFLSDWLGRSASFDSWFLVSLPYILNGRNEEIYDTAAPVNDDVEKWKMKLGVSRENGIAYWYVRVFFFVYLVCVTALWRAWSLEYSRKGRPLQFLISFFELIKFKQASPSWERFV